MEIDGKGKRFDEGKPRVDLIPADALLEMGRVYGYGAKKYGERNFERGMKLSKVLGPLLRHLYKWMQGEERDKESGERHLSHVCFNCLALLAYELRGIDKIAGGHFDDVRPKKQPKD